MGKIWQIGTLTCERMGRGGNMGGGKVGVREGGARGRAAEAAKQKLIGGTRWLKGSSTKKFAIA